MDTITNNLHIFKTNIKDVCPNCAVYKTLSNHTDIAQWSIDTDDVDCVLRIASATLTPALIITTINQLGYQCQEL